MVTTSADVSTMVLCFDPPVFYFLSSTLSISRNLSSTPCLSMLVLSFLKYLEIHTRYDSFARGSDNPVVLTACSLGQFPIKL